MSAKCEQFVPVIAVQGAIWIFPWQFRFEGNFVLLLPWYPNSDEAITTKFCTCHDSYALWHGQTSVAVWWLGTKLQQDKISVAFELKIVNKMDPRMPHSVPIGCVTMSISCTRLLQINSSAPGKFEWNFRHVIFKQILVIDSWGISLIWILLDFTDDQSTLVQVMAWCHQATSH